MISSLKRDTTIAKRQPVATTEPRMSIGGRWRGVVNAGFRRRERAPLGVAIICHAQQATSAIDAPDKVAT